MAANNIKHHSYNYQFLSISENGTAALPSNEVYYGPWGADLSLSEIIDLITQLIKTTPPNGATVAKWNTNNTLSEYYVLDGLLVPKTSNVFDNDIRVVFAYNISTTTENMSAPTISYATSYLNLVNQFEDLKSENGWTMALSESVDDRHVLWQSYGVFKVNGEDGSYTLLTLKGLQGLENDDTEQPRWSTPFMSGGGTASSSTMVANDFYRYSLSNYDVSIPVNANGVVTNKALKQASYTIAQIFWNGVPVLVPDSISILQDFTTPIYKETIVDGETVKHGFTVRKERKTLIYNGLELSVLAFWLAWAKSDPDSVDYLDYADSIKTDEVLKNYGYNLYLSVLYGLGSIGGLQETQFVSQCLRFVEREFVYKLLISPNVINIPTTNIIPSIQCVANKFYWDGSEAYYIQDTDKPHYFSAEYYNNGQINKVWSKIEGVESAVSDGSYIFNNDEMSFLLEGGDNYDSLNIVLRSEDKETIEDQLSVPVFYQSKLRTTTFSYFDCDIINNSVLVGANLVGEEGDDVEQSLRTLTEGYLTITYKGVALNSDQFRITSVKPVGQETASASVFKLIDDNGTVLTQNFDSQAIWTLITTWYNADPQDQRCPKRFYCSKLQGITSVEIEFEYVIPLEDLTITLFTSGVEKFTGTQGQKINVVEGNEFYRLKITPSQIRVSKSGQYIYGNQFQLNVKKVVGKTVLSVDSLSGYRISYTLLQNNGTVLLTLNYDNPQSLILQLPNWNVSYNDSADYAVYTLYKIETGSETSYTYLDAEDCDVYIMPEDGVDGTSPYTLSNIKSTLIVDDDTTLSGLQNTSKFIPELRHGSAVVNTDDYAIALIELSLYEDDVEISNFTFNLEPEIDQVTSLPTGYYYLTQSGNSDLSSKPFDDKDYYGKLTYAAYISSGEYNITPCATFVLEFRILDVSDGQNYSLNISPKVLYKNNVGYLLTAEDEVNTTISFSVVKSIGAINQAYDLQSGDYIRITFIGSNNNDYIEINSFSSHTATIDFSSTNYSFNGTTKNLKLLCESSSSIVCDLYINGICLGSDTIFFSVLGDTGQSVSSDYSLSIDHDTILLDDDTSDEDIVYGTETDITVFHNSEEIDINDLNIDTYRIELSPNLQDVFDILPADSVYEDSYVTRYHLEWKQNASRVETSGFVKIYLQFSDNISSNITISKKQQVLIKDIGDGTVYRLSASPNTLKLNKTGNQRVDIVVTALKGGEAVPVNINQNGILFELYGLPNYVLLSSTGTTPGTNQYNISPRLNLSNAVTITVPELIINTYSSLEVHAYRNKSGNIPVILASEAVDFIKDGEDGNGVEYIYWRSDTLLDSNDNTDPNPLKVNDFLYGYVTTLSGQRKIVARSTSYNKYSDFLPIVVSSSVEASINEGNVSEYSHPHWVDNYPELDEDHRFVYRAERKYNGKTQTWGDFSDPVLYNKLALDGVSPFLLDINNDVVIVDDNTTNDVLRQLSETTAKVWSGITNVSNNYDLRVTEEGGSEDIFDIFITNEDGYKKCHLSLKEGKSFSLDRPNHNIRYFVTPKNSYNLVIAETTLKIKVINVSEDGSMYKLELSYDTLYRTSNGSTLGNGFDEDIHVRIRKITGDLSEISYVSLEDDGEFFITAKVDDFYEPGENISPGSDDIFINSISSENVHLQENSTNELVFDSGIFDRYNQHNCKHIEILAYYVPKDSYACILIDKEFLSFGISGEDGASGCSAIFSNDYIVVDDNSPMNMINGENGLLSTIAQVYYNGRLLTYDGNASINSEYTVTTLFEGTSPFATGQFYNSIQTNQNNKNCRISFNNASISSEKIAIGDYVIKHTITLSSILGGQSFVKYQKLKIVNVSEDGSTYLIIVTPTVVDAYWNLRNIYKINAEDNNIKVLAVKISPDPVKAEIIDLSNLADPISVKVVAVTTSGSELLENYVWDDEEQLMCYVLKDSAYNANEGIDVTLNKYWLVQLVYEYYDETINLMKSIVIDQQSVSINRQGAKGDAGSNAFTVRMFYTSAGHPKQNAIYYGKTDEAGGPQNTNNYLDVLIFDRDTDITNDNEIKSLFCSVTHDGSVDYENGVLKNYLTLEESNYWEAPDAAYATAFVQNFAALSAYIANLSSQEININDGNGTTIGLITSNYGTNENPYPLWLGGTSNNPNFYVDINGNLHCKNAASTFSGSVITEELEIDLGQIDPKYMWYSYDSESNNVTKLYIYINPLNYGTNLNFVYKTKIKYKSIMPTTSEEGYITSKDIVICLDFPAYYLDVITYYHNNQQYIEIPSFEMRGFNNYLSNNEGVLKINSDCIDYMRYADSFINQTVRIVNGDLCSLYLRGDLCLQSNVSDNWMQLCDLLDSCISREKGIPSSEWSGSLDTWHSYFEWTSDVNFVHYKIPSSPLYNDRLIQKCAISEEKNIIVFRCKKMDEKIWKESSVGNVNLLGPDVLKDDEIDNNDQSTYKGIYWISETTYDSPSEDLISANDYLLASSIDLINSLINDDQSEFVAIKFANEGDLTKYGQPLNSQ